VALMLRNGGTVVMMEHFDPEQYLALVEQHRITHTQTGAHDVQPDAEAAGGGAPPLTT
jgi:non-ribosomal peptide synthetase component E (peptide arylation enzyme)